MRLGSSFSRSAIFFRGSGAGVVFDISPVRSSGFGGVLANFDAVTQLQFLAHFTGLALLLDEPANLGVVVCPGINSEGDIFSTSKSTGFSSNAESSIFFG